MAIIYKTSTGKIWVNSNKKIYAKGSSQTFPKTYNFLKNGDPVTLKMPSLDLVDARWDSQAADGEGMLSFSADFPMAIVYKGRMWGSYCCYANQAPAYIYKLPEDYLATGWWVMSDNELQGLAIMATLDPIGAVIITETGKLKVMTPAQAVSTYGGSY